MDYQKIARDIARDKFPPSQLGRDHPADYRPDDGLVDAVNVALVLNKPLLLTGDPGTGKTQLAHSVAFQLAGRDKLNVRSPRVERFEAKSTSLGRDLFYSFDTLGRFQSVYAQTNSRNLDYITYNALGRALLHAMPRGKVEDCLPADFQHDGVSRSIVLIDEIDKAPRDFPNDLLNEIDQMFFRVPELANRRIGGDDEIADDFRPIVIITSNSEKNLPDAFLRRCIYYDIPFPPAHDLSEILLARLPQLKPGKLVDDALSFFYQLKKDNVTEHKLSPAELILWLAFILKRGADPSRPLKAAAKAADEALGALVKNPEGQKRVRAELARFVGGT